MADELDLTVPGRKTKPPRSRDGVRLLLVAVLIGVLANLGVTLWRAGGAPPPEGGAGGLGKEPAKQHALKLEKQGLRKAAVGAWKHYLEVARPDGEESARIWYRIGKLYQEKGAYESALDAFYRSERFAKLDDLEDDIGRRAQECLEALGKFAALRYELASRVSLNKQAEKAGDEVVAEIGPEKITRSDLDRAIERRIAQQLDTFAAYLPEEERDRQKDALLKQFSSDAQRLDFLNQFLVEEILYRKARESGLADKPAIRAQILDLEHGLLARRMLESEMADQIKITEGDLRTYYEANKDKFKTPPRAKISHILVATKEEAETALKRLKKGASFETLARTLSQDEATRDHGGAIEGWVERGGAIPGLGRSPEADALIFNTPAGQTANGTVKTDQGFHLIKVREREEARPRSFKEARSEVARELQTQKEREVQQRLLEELKRRYNVVIHHAAFEKKKAENKE
jgi:parvulin-like peptidyl-prolyl isomerase